MDANVEGRPMPSSSSFFTKVGSVYRAGGLVSWPSQVYSLIGTD